MTCRKSKKTLELRHDKFQTVYYGQQNDYLFSQQLLFYSQISLKGYTVVLPIH